MLNSFQYSLVISYLLFTPAASAMEQDWIPLFNGKDLTGWRASENPDSFWVEDGVIYNNGERSHLFYVGPVSEAEFKDFEWRCDVWLEPGANSGMYFHTDYQEEGYPDKGYEAQLNNSHRDAQRTGGLYDVVKLTGKPAVADREWFTQHVIVRGKRVIVKVNGEVLTDYTEPEDVVAIRKKRPGRVLSSGTIALQGHDPGSSARFRNIEIKPTH